MDELKREASFAFNCKEEEIHVIKRLLGGMSNRTYLIEFNNQKYTFRIPGKKAEKYVDRYIEEKNLKIAESLDLNNGYVYLNKEEGYMIAPFLEGSDLVESSVPLEKVVEVMKKYHESGVLAENDYAPLERLSLYESYLKEFNHQHEDEYFRLKEKFLSNYDFLETSKKVFCHNDTQKANFINSDRLYLLDWEYAGNNDLIYDIACYGNKNFDEAIALLNVYFPQPTNEDFRKLHLWRAFQCLQWHNVAMYKEYIGLSEELSIDFKKVALFYLTLCNTMLETSENYR